MNAPSPVLAVPAEAIAALEADLPRVLQGRTLEGAGWHRPDPLTLFLPLWARRESAGSDFYLLRLGFGYYNKFPPSAQFVNPRTLVYDPERDVGWLPVIDGTPELRVHTRYTTEVPQLICCSSTLEFYLVKHSVEEKHLWTPESMNFGATLHAIQRALTHFYRGRQA